MMHATAGSGSMPDRIGSRPMAAGESTASLCDLKENACEIWNALLVAVIGVLDFL